MYRRSGTQDNHGSFKEIDCLFFYKEASVSVHFFFDRTRCEKSIDFFDFCRFCLQCNWDLHPSRRVTGYFFAFLFLRSMARKANADPPSPKKAAALPVTTAVSTFSSWLEESFDVSFVSPEVVSSALDVS